MVFHSLDYSNIWHWSIWQWLVALLIAVLVFGTKRLTGVARDLGRAIRRFFTSFRSKE